MLLISTILILLISGCESKQPSRIVIEQPNELLVCKIPLDVAYPDKVNWKPVKFYVINKEIMQEILLGNTDYPDVIFAVDTRGYENLSINIQQIINYLESSKEIHRSYREYYRYEDTKSKE